MAIRSEIAFHPSPPHRKVREASPSFSLASSVISRRLQAAQAGASPPPERSRCGLCFVCSWNSVPDLVTVNSQNLTLSLAKYVFPLCYRKGCVMLGMTLSHGNPEHQHLTQEQPQVHQAGTCLGSGSMSRCHRDFREQ